MIKVKFETVCVLPPSVMSVEQTCIKISDLENGIYTPSVHGDFVDAEEDYLDDYDEACDLTNDLDNNFEADIQEDINRTYENEVTDEKDNNDSE